MKREELIAYLAEPENDPATLLATPGSKRQLAADLFAALGESDKRTVNRAAKLLAKLAEAQPATLIDRAGTFVDLLDRPETIVKWNAALAIGHLTASGLDTNNRTDAALPALYAMLEDPKMVTAGHAVDCLGKIAAARPAHRSPITNRLYELETGGPPERDDACRLVLLGKVMGAFLRYLDEAGPRTREKVRALATRATACSRPATARAGARLLKAVRRATDPPRR